MDHNGGPQAHYNGLESDSTFEATTKACADLHLTNYSFDDLKACYTGQEGDSLARASAAKAEAYGTQLPVWMLVDGKLVTVGHNDPMSSWTPLMKAAICDAYQGVKPASCSSFVV